MRPGWLLRITVTLFWAQATFNESAWAAASPVPPAPSLFSPASSQTVEAYLLPTQQVVQELQSGFNRLNRMCTYGAFISQPGSPSSDLITLQLNSSRDQLLDVQSQIRSVLAEFRQKSSLSSANFCRFVPEFSLIGMACQAYRQDANKLATVTRVAEQLTAEAAARINLYEKYAQLEARGCTRAGFVNKLWQTEQTLLWPLVVQSPGFFKRQLSLEK
ncbi:hypothetical protein [Limnohabitans sp. 15K]|uniref:hypothetical protein n=1 Tax=Limnohabitans sp. 15K TaxID=1100706 RepID=UPI00117A6D91|nr:hypothetical protein [Limnohabitans sp. 15K]